MVWVPVVIPPRGMVTINIKLCTMVIQVRSFSALPSPPKCMITVFKEMISTLSNAMIRNGESPSVRILFITS
jgi:hypothetical protein